MWLPLITTLMFLAASLSCGTDKSKKEDCCLHKAGTTECFTCHNYTEAVTCYICRCKGVTLPLCMRTDCERLTQEHIEQIYADQLAKYNADMHRANAGGENDVDNEDSQWEIDTNYDEKNSDMDFMP